LGVLDNANFPELTLRVTPFDKLKVALVKIEQELQDRLADFRLHGRLLKPSDSSNAPALTLDARRPERRRLRLRG